MEQRTSAVVMRILRWMRRGVTREDTIRNDTQEEVPEFHKLWRNEIGWDHLDICYDCYDLWEDDKTANESIY